MSLVDEGQGFTFRNAGVTWLQRRVKYLLYFFAREREKEKEERKERRKKEKKKGREKRKKKGKTRDQSKHSSTAGANE